MKKKNTSAITGKLMRKAALTAMIPGGVLAALLSLLGLTYGYSANLVPILSTALGLFVVCVLIGLFFGWLKANRFKSAVKTQEKGGIGTFDEDVLKPITTDNTAWMGDNWILLCDDGQYIPLNRAHIVSCDGVNERREGMKKLWLGIATDKGERPAVLYAACEPDALAVVSRWLGSQPAAPLSPFGADSASSPIAESIAAAHAAAPAVPPAVPPVSPAPAQPVVNPAVPPVSPASPAAVPPKEEPASPAPAVPPVRTIPAGTCPFCFGPNDPSTEVCQWCGSKLK